MSKPSLREGSLIDIQREWRAIPHPYRFATTFEVPKPGHLLLVDVVLGGTTDREPDWATSEKSIGILKVSLNTFSMPLLRVTPLATISAHAIARFFQRAVRPDEATLLDELRAVAVGPEKTTTDQGTWLSYLRNSRTPDGRMFKVRVFRTFIADYVSDGAAKVSGQCVS